MLMASAFEIQSGFCEPAKENQKAVVSIPKETQSFKVGRLNAKNKLSVVRCISGTNIPIELGLDNKN